MVNTNAITLYNGTNSFALNAGYGTYLGSVYMTDNGKTSMQFKPTPATGGTANVLGLYNAYNRLRTIAGNNDSTYPAWTDSTASWEALDDNDNNSISFLDGLQQSFVDAQAQVNISTSSSSVWGWIGVNLDSATPVNPGGPQGGTNNTSTYGAIVTTFDHFLPQMGFHVVYAIQYASGATVTFENASGYAEELKIELEM